MRVGVRVRRDIGRFEMDYVLWLCHYRSTRVSGCSGLFFLLFSLFDVQCCVSNGGFFRYLLSTLVLMILDAGELVGIVLHSFFSVP